MWMWYSSGLKVTFSVLKNDIIVIPLHEQSMSAVKHANPDSCIIT